MYISAFVHFDGKCREAVEFYANVFGIKKPIIKLYGDMPEDPESPLPEKYGERVAFACLKIKGNTVMFSDYPPKQRAPKGSPANLAIVVKSAKRVEKLYAKLVRDGQPGVEPQKTSWSKCFAALTDRFGVVWHIMLESKEMRG